MKRLLTGLALACAGLAALFAIVFTGEAASLLLVLVAAGVGVVSILQKDRVGVVTGIAVLASCVLGLLVILGSITFRGTSVGDADAAQGAAMGLSVAMVGAAGFVGAQWNRFGPRWVAVAGVAAALVGILFAFATKENLGVYSQPSNLGVAVFALGAGVPAVMALLERRTT